MKIYTATYKDVTGIACETEQLKALFLPEYGAKLVSLKNSTSGQEFMEQTKGEGYLKPIYGGVYIDAECSSFDDMFPNIDPFICDEHPWTGAEYPDHGEVYALKWDSEILEDCLHMWVYSVRFGYRLDKWVTEKNGAIYINYKVQNLTDFEFNYIYAPHCMLAAQEGTVIELPYEENTAVTTLFSISGDIGSRGTKGLWPVFGNKNLSKVGPKSECDSYKILFDEPIPEGRCTLRHPDQTSITMCYDGKVLPYTEIWINTGAFQNKYNVALEPCSGPYDRPDVAKLYGKHSVLKGKESQEWFVSFQI